MERRIQKLLMQGSVPRVDLDASTADERMQILVVNLLLGHDRGTVIRADLPWWWMRDVTDVVSLFIGMPHSLPRPASVCLYDMIPFFR